MNILITAGGTTEKIDEVRAITNTGTGTLGALIAERFAEEDSSHSLLYVCSRSAVRPSVPAEIYIADDTMSLEWIMREICSTQRIDVIVHSMAVSDYRTKMTTEPSLVAESMADEINRRNPKDELHPDELADLLLNAPALESHTKIRSGHNNLMVLLEKTPKIIGMLRGLQPQALIVGFKLLVDAPQSELLAEGQSLLNENGCDFVFANDMRTVTTGKHAGYLIDAAGEHTAAVGKENIAELIVTAVRELRSA